MPSDVPAQYKPATRGSSQRIPFSIASIGVFAALIAVCAWIPAVYVAFIPVPLTLQTLMITLTAIVLGPWKGVGAVALYIVVGLLGVPIFAGYKGGLGVLAGPSAGYLLSFLALSLIVGSFSLLAQRRRGFARVLLLAVGAFVGLVVNHAFGIFGMMLNARLSMNAAVAADAIFIGGDLLKAGLAVALSLPLIRALPQLSRR